MLGAQQPPIELALPKMPLLMLFYRCRSSTFVDLRLLRNGFVFFIFIFFSLSTLCIDTGANIYGMVSVYNVIYRLYTKVM